MKTVDLAHETPSLLELLHLAGEGNLILRAPDGKEFVLAEIDEFDREVALVRQHPELMELLERRARPERTYSLEEARDILGID